MTPLPCILGLIQGFSVVPLSLFALAKNPLDTQFLSIKAYFSLIFQIIIRPFTCPLSDFYKSSNGFLLFIFFIVFFPHIANNFIKSFSTFIIIIFCIIIVIVFKLLKTNWIKIITKQRGKPFVCIFV